MNLQSKLPFKMKIFLSHISQEADIARILKKNIEKKCLNIEEDLPPLNYEVMDMELHKLTDSATLGRIRFESDHPEQVGNNEWLIYLPKMSDTGGWIQLEVDLPDQVKKTFGREGWQFDQLKKFRIRGHLSIAEIRMHKP